MPVWYPVVELYKSAKWHKPIYWFKKQDNSKFKLVYFKHIIIKSLNSKDKKSSEYTRKSSLKKIE